MVISVFAQMSTYRTDVKSETLWSTSFEGKPLTIEMLFDFFVKAHEEGFERSTKREKVLGSIQPVIQALLFYLAKATQIAQLEDLLLDHHKEGSDAWICRQLQNFKKKDAEFVDLKKEKKTMAFETILGTNIEPFKFMDLEIIGGHNSFCLFLLHLIIDQGLNRRMKLKRR